MNEVHRSQEWWRNGLYPNSVTAGLTPRGHLI